MPTTLPDPAEAGRNRPLTWRETAEVVWVVSRMAIMNRRMERVSERWEALGRERDQRRLMTAARTWCRLSARVSALRGAPQTPAALELQALFGNRTQGEMSHEQPLAHRDP